jgi:hypothetical protein
VYPEELLAGVLVCGTCIGSVGKVSGNRGGYYGCLRAGRCGCKNRILIRKDVAGRAVLAMLTGLLTGKQFVAELSRQLADAVQAERSASLHEWTLQQAAYDNETRKLARLVRFVEDGHHGKALETAIAESERRLRLLETELHQAAPKGSRLTPPPAAWVGAQTHAFSELCQRYPVQGAELVRTLLGQLLLVPVLLRSVRHYVAVPTWRERSRIDTEFLVAASLAQQPNGGVNSQVGFVLPSDLAADINERLATAEIQERCTGAIASMLLQDFKLAKEV